MKQSFSDGRGSVNNITEPVPGGAPPGSTAVDDATAAYILETRRPFEDLRQVAGQLAGLLVLAAAGSKNAGPHHPLLDAAGLLYREAIDGIHQARVTNRARRHHHHLLQAAATLGAALAAAKRSPQIDPVLTPLRSAYDQLLQASQELPGFAMVAFEQGCCGRKA